MRHDLRQQAHRERGGNVQAQQTQCHDADERRNGNGQWPGAEKQQSAQAGSRGERARQWQGEGALGPGTDLRVSEHFKRDHDQRGEKDQSESGDDG